MFAQMRPCPCGVPLGVVGLGPRDAAAGGLPIVHFSGALLLFALLASSGGYVTGVPLGVVGLGARDTAAGGLPVVHC